MPKRRRKKKKNGYDRVLSLTKPEPKSSLVDWGYHRSLVENNHETARINDLNPRSVPFAQFKKDRCPNGRLTAEKLISISKSVLFDSAIEQVSNGVARMKWTIVPPEELDLAATLETAKHLDNAMSKPNHEDNGNYRAFVKSCVRNLLLFNIAPVQRQAGDEAHPFWLWDENPKDILRNKTWHPGVYGLAPRFFHDPVGNRNPKQFAPIMAENMFVIQNKVSSFKEDPPSPVEVAYDLVRSWLGLGSYQERITSKAVRDYLIALDQEVDNPTLQKLKAWWRNDVEGSGEVPIFGGSLQVHKFGAKDDSELFATYKDHLGGLIALAFGLSQKDFNIEMRSGDNRATANVVADKSFQNAILPISDTISEALSSEVVEFYAPGYKFETSDREPRGEQAEAETVSLLFEKGIITQNEARTRVGLDAIEEGDEVEREGRRGSLAMTNREFLDGESKLKQVKVSEDRKQEQEQEQEL